MKTIRNKSLEEQILDYSSRVYPFHMPGHKQSSGYSLTHPEKLDITEVPGMDNLHNPKGIIMNAQERAKMIYKTKETYFLVNGSSCGLLAAISSCTKTNDTILIARNCHRSVYNALIINRLNPIYVYPQVINKFGILGGILPEDVDNILKNNDKISCVVITSPTYEGFTSNIRKISKVVHNHNKILIVDEAHGAHFIFNDFFPESAIEHGADIVIQSLHKTLPSYTQTALLHVNTERINIDILKEYLALFQTSSPSYILMSSIDNCISTVSQNNFFDKYINDLCNIRKKLLNLKTIKLVDSDLKGKYGIYDLDLSKLVMIILNSKLSSKNIEKELREKYYIQLEVSGMTHIIALSSVVDSYDALLNLYNSLSKIDKNNEIINTDAIKYDIIKDVSIKYQPSIASEMGIEKVILEDSVGRVSRQFITQFPPGIPLLVPGEEITKKLITFVKDMIKNNIDIIGIENNIIHVIK